MSVIFVSEEQIEATGWVQPALVSKSDAPDAVVIKKAEDELQVVWGEVYSPTLPDSQGDFASADTIREMAYAFMRKSDMGAIDTSHSQQDNGAYIVESFIARDNDDTFIPGSWVIGVKVPDAEWQMVKSGELNGFSMDGCGIRVDTIFQCEMPEVLTGVTYESTDGYPRPHFHNFFVKYDSAGRFLGSETDLVVGHKHEILKGTATELVENHRHRFSFAEGVLVA